MDLILIVKEQVLAVEDSVYRHPFTNGSHRSLAQKNRSLNCQDHPSPQEETPEQ